MAKSPNILFFIENYDRGGAGKYLFDLCTIANSQSLDVRVASNFQGLVSDELAWFVDLGIPCESLNTWTWAELRRRTPLCRYFLFKLALRALYLPFSPVIWIYQMALCLRFLRRIRPDKVFVAQGGYPAGGVGLRMILAASWLRIPCSVSIVSMPSVARSDRLRMLFWDRIVPRVTRKVVVNSKAISQRLLSHRFIESKFVTLYGGLKGKLEHSKRKNEKIRILFMARLDANKGVETAFSVFERLSPTIRCQTEWQFFGFGPLQKMVEAFANKYPDNVHFGGFASGPLQNYFLDTDIYFLPSEQEGLPYTILEAMRASCCVVSTPVGGIPEAIETGACGVLLSPRDVQAFADAITSLVEDRSLIVKYGRAAKERFDRHFEFEAIIEQHRNIFNF